MTPLQLPESYLAALIEQDVVDAVDVVEVVEVAGVGEVAGVEGVETGQPPWCLGTNAVGPPDVVDLGWEETSASARGPDDGMSRHSLHSRDAAGRHRSRSMLGCDEARRRGGAADQPPHEVAGCAQGVGCDGGASMMCLGTGGQLARSAGLRSDGGSWEPPGASPGVRADQSAERGARGEGCGQRGAVQEAAACGASVSGSLDRAEGAAAAASPNVWGGWLARAMQGSLW